MNAFEFHCPTRIICGEHALHKLPVILVEMGVTKPLVVTDANLVALGITDHAIHRLTEAGFPFAFYDQVPPDSSLPVVNDVAAIYEQEGCDGFIVRWRFGHRHHEGCRCLDLGRQPRHR